MTETQPAPSPTPGARHVVVVPGSIDMVSLLGPGDDHLSLIEDSFDADVHVRGNRITLHGEPHEVALAQLAGTAGAQPVAWRVQAPSERYARPGPDD